MCPCRSTSQDTVLVSACSLALCAITSSLADVGGQPAGQQDACGALPSHSLPLPSSPSGRCARCAPAPSSCRPARTPRPFSTGGCLALQAARGSGHASHCYPCIAHAAGRRPRCRPRCPSPLLLVLAACRHTRVECDPSNYDRVHRKPRCTAPGCREKLTSTNSYTCRDCGVTVRGSVAALLAMPLIRNCGSLLCVSVVAVTSTASWQQLPCPPALPPMFPQAGVPAAPLPRRPQVPCPLPSAKQVCLRHRFSADTGALPPAFPHAGVPAAPPPCRPQVPWQIRSSCSSGTESAGHRWFSPPV